MAFVSWTVVTRSPNALFLHRFTAMFQWNATETTVRAVLLARMADEKVAVAVFAVVSSSFRRIHAPTQIAGCFDRSHDSPPAGSGTVIVTRVRGDSFARRLSYAASFLRVLLVLFAHTESLFVPITILFVRFLLPRKTTQDEKEKHPDERYDSAGENKEDKHGDGETREDRTQDRCALQPSHRRLVYHESLRWNALISCSA